MWNVAGNWNKISLSTKMTKTEIKIKINRNIFKKTFKKTNQIKIYKFKLKKNIYKY